MSIKCLAAMFTIDDTWKLHLISFGGNSEYRSLIRNEARHTVKHHSAH